MMNALASICPGGNVRAEAAFPAKEALRRGLDACQEMFPPDGG